MEKHHTHHKALKPGVMQVLLRKSMERILSWFLRWDPGNFLLCSPNNHVSNGFLAHFLCDAAPPPISNDDF